MSAVASARYWVSTVSREHALVGWDGALGQVCHGKKDSLARMKKDDWIVYSPKMSMGGREIYEFETSRDFIPFRRHVIYLKTAKEQPILGLLDRLSFTRSKNCGAKFRFGIFELSKEDFDVVYEKMTVTAL